MKTLRNICAVAILTLTVAVSASAGQIQFPGVVSGGDTGGAKSDITTPIILAVTSVVS